jgi:PPM family protein phosphatase
MHYKFCSRTDAGLARENNEDAVEVDREIRLAVLADGMGGYNAGEVASAMATGFIKSELGGWLAQADAATSLRDVRHAMEECVGRANQLIFDAANRHPQYAGMGTTLVLTVVRSDVLLVGHIGDSRCYRWREGLLHGITRDHSLLQEQLDAGLLTETQAQMSNIRNLVTRAMGVEPEVLLDINEFSLQPGDIYLLCSDGLNDMVDDDAIARILGEAADLEHKADALVNAANAQGGRDNVSVVLIEVLESAEKRGLIARLLGT